MDMKNITQNNVSGFYYVKFGKKIAKSFNNLEDAIAYRDAIKAEKLRIKTEQTINELRAKERKEVAKIADETYPQNILEDIRCEDCSIDDLQIALNSLSERERAFVKEFYEDKKTMTSIARERGVTKQLVSASIGKSLSKIKREIKYTIPHWRKADEIHRQQVEEQERIEAWRSKIFEEFAKTGEYGEDMQLAFGKAVVKKPMEYEANRPIDDLSFSVRTYNCLRRAGIQTLGELMELSETQVMKIRNLGRKSYKEIIDKLESMGLYLWKGNS